ncbi:secretion protein HylD [Bordetella genomosp. 5]|uniref:HlyD family efflux transporter periplasmic adaptor subunit n=1 Tax=Bordetella genomosp. 5 TaxID=1395608 RepID=UPI000B9ECAD2|nr:HlyD family efflux transporter periplasmic adaptor subunit [Bordetella genomosp. 5]OZI41467.1 secretion protein HylD [Bordetella genomosp. 5]
MSKILFLLGSLLAALALGFWAWEAPLDIITRAPARVVSSQHTQIVQAASDGVLAQLAVREGEHVRAGQLLARFEDGQESAGVQASRAKVAALRATQTRLKAEVFGRPLRFGPELKGFGSFVADQTELHTRRAAALKQELDALAKAHATISRELSLAERLLKHGDIGEAEVLRLRRQLIENEGAASTKRSNFLRDAQAEMSKVNEELSSQEQVLADREINLERTRIHAPVAAVVTNIDINTIGARVRPGQVLMTLLPTGAALTLDADVSPRDVGRILVGMPANIKLDAFDSNVYGALVGTVTYISQDALARRDEGGRDASFYRVRIAVRDAPASHPLGSTNPAPDASGISLQAGMTATAEIVTGQQTVAQYLLKPLNRTMSEAFSEH